MNTSTAIAIIDRPTNYGANFIPCDLKLIEAVALTTEDDNLWRWCVIDELVNRMAHYNYLEDKVYIDNLSVWDRIMLVRAEKEMRINAQYRRDHPYVPSIDEDQREDALQQLMEDSLEFDEYEPDSEEYAEETEWKCTCPQCNPDEEDDYADSGDWGYTEIDALRDDIDDLRLATKRFDSKLDIFEQRVRALKGDTCTAMVVYQRYFPPVLELEIALSPF